ncbi:tetratricopeptide repeat protein [Actinoallomurus iriomotensis]|uniref:Tetratricopeptide repeat protein n=1 Tax=Actinoallomurus iriomotensis TaxID=478107 RepID=A0A9W6VM45_9ACTN|nr:tetratricopeptide repeat protein [Actinoallomurus iriomotensis]GLY77183.1 hypothetical protein Airi01_054500 [Actinoallomurus iriomotensis]
MTEAEASYDTASDLCSAGRHADAEPHARRAAALAPDVADHHRLLAEILLELDGRGGEAVSAARRAVETDPADHWNHYTLYRALSARLDWAACEEPLLAAVALVPDDPDYRLFLGLLRVRLGRSPEAVPDLQAVLDGQPGPGVLRTLIEYLESCGIPGPVRTTYERCAVRLGRPDLSVPGAAGTDRTLLREQAEVALRLSTALGQDEPTTLAARERARALAEAVLAVDRRNKTAKAALKRLATFEDIPLSLYAAPDTAREHGRTLTDLGERISALAARLETEPGDPDLVVRLLRTTLDARDLCTSIGMTETREQLTALAASALTTLREHWRPEPEERRQLADALDAAGLAREYPAFHHWLLAPAGETRHADAAGHGRADGDTPAHRTTRAHASPADPDGPRRTGMAS